MKRHTLQLLISFVCAAGALAQNPLKPRAAITKPATTVVDVTKHDAERVSVNFRDDMPVRLRQDKLVAEGTNSYALNAASGLLNRLAIAGAKWERHHSVAEEKLSEMREQAQRNTGKAMADLNNAYILRVPNDMNAEQLIDELHVEAAAVVANVEGALSIGHLDSHFDCWCVVPPCVLPRVFEQICHDHTHQVRVGVDHEAIGDDDGNVAARMGSCNTVRDFFCEGRKIDRLCVHLAAPGA